MDGELEYSLELRALVCEQIRLQRPEVVLTHDPWRRYMMHPDHRITGWAVVDGVVAARDPPVFPRTTERRFAAAPAGGPVAVGRR